MNQPAAGPAFNANNQQCTLYTLMHLSRNTHKIRTISPSVVTRSLKDLSSLFPREPVVCLVFLNPVSVMPLQRTSPRSHENEL